MHLGFSVNFKKSRYSHDNPDYLGSTISLSWSFTQHWDSLRGMLMKWVPWQGYTRGGGTAGVASGRLDQGLPLPRQNQFLLTSKQTLGSTKLSQAGGTSKNIFKRVKTTSQQL